MHVKYLHIYYVDTQEVFSDFFSPSTSLGLYPKMPFYDKASHKDSIINKRH